MLSKIELIKEIKSCHKLWSVQIMSFLAIFSFIEGALPFWRDVIPVSAYPWIVGVVSTLAALSRIIKQSSVEGVNNEQSDKTASE